VSLGRVVGLGMLVGEGYERRTDLIVPLLSATRSIFWQVQYLVGCGICEAYPALCGHHGYICIRYGRHLDGVEGPSSKLPEECGESFLCRSKEKKGTPTTMLCELKALTITAV